MDWWTKYFASLDKMIMERIIIYVTLGSHIYLQEGKANRTDSCLDREEITKVFQKKMLDSMCHFIIWLEFFDLSNFDNHICNIVRINSFTKMQVLVTLIATGNCP